MKFLIMITPISTQWKSNPQQVNPTTMRFPTPTLISTVIIHSEAMNHTNREICHLFQTTSFQAKLSLTISPIYSRLSFRQGSSNTVYRLDHPALEAQDQISDSIHTSMLTLIYKNMNIPNIVSTYFWAVKLNK